VAITLLQFRKYADKCRSLASSDRPLEERMALREMAQAWEALAEGRRQALFGPERTGQTDTQHHRHGD
jgi:hypothetical protein